MLGSGGQADIALRLDPHDKDLAMRIRNQADRVAWAALTLEDETSYPGGGWNSADGARRTPAQGDEAVTAHRARSSPLKIHETLRGSLASTLRAHGYLPTRRA